MVQIQAQNVCSGTQALGNLVMIKDLAMEEFVTELLQDEQWTEAIWIGVRDFGSGFVYQNNNPLEVGYQPFKQDPSSDKCTISMESASPGVKEWVKQPCTGQAHAFVCEAPPTEKELSCDPGWHLDSENAVCIKAIKSKRRTFNGARKYCEKLNADADLATKMITRSQRSDIYKYIRFVGHFWIGFERATDTEPFKDIDDGIAVGQGAPFKRVGNNGHCVSIRRKRWFSKRCNRGHFFICQKPRIEQAIGGSPNT